MWWLRQPRAGARPLLPANVLEVVACAYAMVEVGGLNASGPQRGRDFEQLFYRVCGRRGVALTEQAGARTITGQRSASGLMHEIDAASRGISASTCWELKHVSSPLEKNELLVFNAKTLDYLLGGGALFRRTPLLRFLLSGNNIRDECRVYAAQWSISVIEPGFLPAVLIHEAVARGLAPSLSRGDRDAVEYLVPWACRSAQVVTQELAQRCSAGGRLIPESVERQAKELIDLQEQVGRDVLDGIEEECPDWINHVAEALWVENGGWR